MTALDPVDTPLCPGCGTNDAVERRRLPWGAAPTALPRARWVCMGCLTLFDGGADEWARWAPNRVRREERDA